ncbi:MAG: FAD-dependent oxidoreductase [Rhodoferax sp.]|nr:FAD-dependent oxidoreductase [Rhodoferax sp.]
MKIAVIGAGITGIATAYELVCDGHTVQVFDKAVAAASGYSFATGGLVSPSLINPWTLPDWPMGASIRRLTSSAGIKLRSVPTLTELRWLKNWSRMPKNSGASSAFSSYQQLLSWSQSQMQTIAVKHRLEFERSEGAMLLVPTEKDYQALQTGLARLKELGVACNYLSPEQARLTEPGLGQAVALHGALHFPGDEVGNCRQFAMLLRTACMELGVQFHFNAHVLKTHAGQQHTLEVSGWTDRPGFDAVVLCPGADSAGWAAASRLRLPLTLLHGYTLSAALREPLHAPRSAVVTMDSGIVLSRQGMRVRVVGGAEIGGASRQSGARAEQDLFRALHNYFPGSANLTTGVQSWRGARVFTPDCMPVVGPTPTPGVWINAGHGANGWGMAQGCARILADRVQGKRSEVDIQSLRPDRFAG